MGVLTKSRTTAAAFLLATISFSAQAAVEKGTPCVAADATAMTGVVPVSVAAQDCVGILRKVAPPAPGPGPNYGTEEMNGNLVVPLADHTSEGGLPWDPGAFKRVGWLEENKINAPASGPVGSIGFKVDSVVGTLLTWSTTTPLNGTWVVKVKQASEQVFFLFENLVQTNSGTVELSRLANPGWSNIALVGREGGGPPNDVPAPASLGLMGAGLALMWMRRRRDSARKPV